MTQKLIDQIETKIIQTQNNIQQQKETIHQHENNLLTLIEELTQIKQQINMNKNTKNSLQGSNNK